jgi:hypothetical protein
VAVGDFNGDGSLDLVVANEQSNDISVLLGNGDGSFQTGVSFEAGSRPQFVAVGHFNSKEVQDLAVANYYGAVVVLLGNGDGSFQEPRYFWAVPGRRLESVAVGDFNGDGLPDLVAASSFFNSVSVLLGNGDGTFQTAQNFGAGNGPYSVAVGDFNGDGWQDLAVANNGSNDISVLINNLPR